MGSWGWEATDVTSAIPRFTVDRSATTQISVFTKKFANPWRKWTLGKFGRIVGEERMIRRSDAKRCGRVMPKHLMTVFRRSRPVAVDVSKEY